MSCTAWTGPVTSRQPRRSTRRGEDYERVAVGPRNVCDDRRRIAVPGVAAPRRRHREREREDDLGRPGRVGNADDEELSPVRDAESTSDMLAAPGGSTDARGLSRTLAACR